jgi:hypothetical protein
LRRSSRPGRPRRAHLPGQRKRTGATPSDREYSRPDGRSPPFSDGRLHGGRPYRDAWPRKRSSCVGPRVLAISVSWRRDIGGAGAPGWPRSALGNGHGVSGTPENVRRCHHGRFPHPGHLPGGEGDSGRAARDFR